MSSGTAPLGRNGTSGWPPPSARASTDSPPKVDGRSVPMVQPSGNAEHRPHFTHLLVELA